MNPMSPAKSIFIAVISLLVTATPLAQPKPASIKQPIYGLVNMGDINFYNQPNATPTNDPSSMNNYAQSFSGIVINLTWAQLQPQQNGAIQRSVLDDALTLVKNYNTEHASSPLTVKLRIWGGFAAPNWAMSLDGGPVAIPPNPKKPQQKHTKIGIFWGKQYNQAWQAFQDKLAALYDTNPLISEVAITSCASSTDEPFVSWIDSGTITALHKAGYKDAQQMQCLTNAISHYRGWKNTWLDFTFNPFHLTDNSSNIQIDDSFTTSVMNQCAQLSNCIISNHGLIDPNRFSTDEKAIYTAIQTTHQKYKTPVDFQTVSPKTQVSWCSTISAGITYDANSIELWPGNGGFTTLDPAIVNTFSTALKTKNSASCQNP